MKKHIISVAVVICALVILRLTIPCTVKGCWTGSSLIRVVDGHSFIRFKDGIGVQYCEHIPPASAHPYHKTGQNEWRWDYHNIKLLPNTDTWAVDTNTFAVLHPGWFFMSAEFPMKKETFRLHRDLRFWRMQNTIQNQPIETSEQYARRMTDLRKKTRETSKEGPTSHSSATREPSGSLAAQ